MDATEFYFRCDAATEESPGSVSKTGRKLLRMTIRPRLLDVVPQDRSSKAALEMAFRGGSVSKRGGQEVVDHDKGQRLTKGKPRTSYKDPRDKRPMAPLLHL